MLVDVIIPAHNPGSYLIEAINSALKQSYQNFKITVVDDCSTENVKSIVDRYQSVNYIRSDVNVGPAGARNIGIRATNGELISFLDADDVWDPQKLAYSVQAFKKYKSISMTCGNYKIMVGHKIRPPFYKKAPAINWHSLMRINYVASGSTTIKRSVLKEIAGPDGFDERFWIAEDAELWLRISERHRIKYLNQILYYYRIIPRGNSLTQREDIQAKHLENLRIMREESTARIKALQNDKEEQDTD